MLPWTVASWQTKSIAQPITYPSSMERDTVVSQLKELPPLVTLEEIDHLKKNLAQAAKGEAFLFQAGDCAESFADCTTEIIQSKLNILLEISSVLDKGLKKPIINVGRIAGQYTKPRSCEYETIGGISLPSYRGDLVNDSTFDPKAREPDPERMLRGYHYSALTLNFIRALASDFYVSHEALHLHYEQALTRLYHNDQWYNIGTHFPWIGMRTSNFVDSAHVEYARGIANPVAIKVGPQMTPSLLKELMSFLNPHNEWGKLTLIHRFGASHIGHKLPPLIEVVKEEGAAVLWSCDPMHGNTTFTAEGYKTRRFDIILSELEQALCIHRQHKSILGGVHLELTGDEVTECLGGARGLTEENLKEAYRTLVDPRLNREQSLEMAYRLAHF